MTIYCPGPECARASALAVALAERDALVRELEAMRAERDEYARWAGLLPAEGGTTREPALAALESCARALDNLDREEQALPRAPAENVDQALARVEDAVDSWCVRVGAAVRA